MTTNSTNDLGLGKVTVTLTITISADRLKAFVDEIVTAAQATEPGPPSPIGGEGPIQVPEGEPKIDIALSTDWAPAGNS